MTDAWGSIHQEEARVVFADGGAIDGHLHLLARLNYPPGPETPLDMLNRPEAFFALTGGGSAPVLVSKAQAAVVSCRQGTLPADPERLSAARLVPIDVVMASGLELRGQCALELPPVRSRTLDFVNTPGQFFALWSGDVTHFVNKALVRLVRPLD
jgi:hypothetical protein